MKNRILLLKPHLGLDELNYVGESFKDNWITTKGKNLDLFEEELGFFLGKSKSVLCVNSGTSAIHIALILLGIGKGDKVLCQSFSFCASANPIIYAGAEPVFIDSEQDTWNMSPYYLEAALNDLQNKNDIPKAVVVTNSYGMPARWKEILEVSNRYNIPVIEDAAESLGSIYFGQKCGLLGDIGIFSFNGNKIVTTSAGGALILSSANLKCNALHLSSQAKLDSYGFQHDQIGYNYRMSNVLAGIGRGQLKMIQKRVQQKRDLNDFYSAIISDVSELNLKREPNTNIISNYWLNCITSEDKNQKNVATLKRLFLQENIEYREFWYPLHLQRMYNGTSFYGDGKCLEIYKSGIVAPSSTNMTKDEKTRIKGVFKQFKNC